jgi:hypothetical protein
VTLVGRVWPRHGHRGRPLNSVVRAHVKTVRDIARWTLDPVPWRGLKVMLAGLVAAGIGGGFTFLSDAVRLPGTATIGAAVFFLGWVTGIFGLIGHFRWFWRHSSNPNSLE